jgi:IPT/TIG domain
MDQKYGQGAGGQADVTWQNAFVDYLLSKAIRSSFYRCYAPNSGSFSPRQGRVGTMVTLYGSGFTGSNGAWVGAAHNAPVRVVSDTQVQVTIPAGATTGAIGIFNPAHAAFTPTWFSVR